MREAANGLLLNSRAAMLVANSPAIPDGSAAMQPAARWGARPDQNAEPEHGGTVEHDPADRLRERRIHIAGADIGDRPQFEEYHSAGDHGRDPKCAGPGIRNEMGQWCGRDRRSWSLVRRSSRDARANRARSVSRHWIRAQR